MLGHSTDWECPFCFWIFPSKSSHYMDYYRFNFELRWKPNFTQKNFYLVTLTGCICQWRETQSFILKADRCNQISFFRELSSQQALATRKKCPIRFSFNCVDHHREWMASWNKEKRTHLRFLSGSWSRRVFLRWLEVGFSWTYLSPADTGWAFWRHST